MREKKIEIKGPNLPLDPIVGELDSEYSEIKAAHDALLAEFKRLDEICSSQVEGASWRLDHDKRIYTVEEYNEMLSAYKSARKAYVERYRAKLETIDMVREKIRKLQEEEDRFAVENGCNEIEEPQELLDFKEMPNESWEEFLKRQKEYMDRLHEVTNKSLESMQKQCEQNKFLVRSLEEMGKFGQLEYELEFRLRHTYINPETGEQEYRPDDDVGEGLICLGSRDHNPKREDFDD